MFLHLDLLDRCNNKLSRGLLWVTLTIMFAGCTQPGSDEMRLSSWVSSPSETELFKQTLLDFEQSHPEVSYKFEPIPGNYSEKIQLMLGTGTAPDLFFLKGLVAPSYMSFQVLKPLDDLIAATPDFDREDFYPFTLKAFQRDGIQYGLPKDFNPYVLFYNKAMFAEAGLDTVPSNWAELEEWSRRLTLDKDQDGTTDQFGFVVEPSLEMVMPFVYQNEGAFQNPDGSLGITDPNFVDALEFYYGLYEDGLATLPVDHGVPWNGDVFGKEKAAMVISGGWLMPFLADNFPEIDYGVAILPAGKRVSTVAFTTAYVMPKDTRYEPDAWKMMNYLVGKEGMAKWTSKGLALPSRRSVAERNGFLEHPVFKTFMQSAEVALPLQVEYSERGFEEVVVAMQAIFFQGTPPRKAMEDIKKRIEKYRLVKS